MKTTDYPYDSWFLRCIADNLALLTVVTKRIKINIEIHPLIEKLVEMENAELKHLNNVELHPGILLLELSKCGIHLLPEDEDSELAGIHLKCKEAEEKAIMDIAQTVKIFAFQSLKWNQTAPKETVICRVRENPDYFKMFYEDGEDDWESLMCLKYFKKIELYDKLMWWKNKVCFIFKKYVSLMPGTVMKLSKMIKRKMIFKKSNLKLEARHT